MNIEKTAALFYAAAAVFIDMFPDVILKYFMAQAMAVTLLSIGFPAFYLALQKEIKFLNKINPIIACYVICPPPFVNVIISLECPELILPETTTGINRICGRQLSVISGGTDIFIILRRSIQSFIFFTIISHDDQQ